MYVSRPRAFSLLGRFMTKASVASALLATLFFSPLPAAQAVGSWTLLANRAPDLNGMGTMLLLTDGTVMVQGITGVQNTGASRHWYKLTPDAQGNYADGTWTQLADMHHERLYYASTVLRNGKVFIAGGEYTEASTPDTNTAEIYDPLTDVWTEIDGPGWANIGDAPVQTLFDGTVLLGSIDSYYTGLYDYTTNTWTAGGNKPYGAGEESWSLLPDQTVLTVEIGNSPYAQKYLPSSNSWVSAGQTPAGHDVVQASSEIGPGVLLANGQCLFVGATGHTTLYTMPSDPAQTGNWMAGPNFPTDVGGNQLEAKDAPGCLMVNGKVLCLVAPHGDSDSGFPYGQQFFEYTYDAKGGTLAAAPDSGLASADSPAFYGRMLALPNGQVLFSNYDPQLAVYTPDGGPSPAWKPVVSGVSANADGSYLVSGTQFNGLSEGAYYGDDAAMATNYPLVRLTDGAGAITYARTYNHSTMGLATGSLPVSTNFTLPPSLTPGSYQLQVVANGIASDPVSFIVPASLVSLTFPSSVPGGTVVTATVTLNANAPTDTVVGLASSDPSVVRINRGVIVPAGARSVTFTINTYRSHIMQMVTVRATLGQVVQTVPLTITGR